MSMAIFLAFMLVYALLIISHRESNARATRMFFFGFLVTVLYASVYSLYATNPAAGPALILMVTLTTLAILTQYFHHRAVASKRVKPTKLIVNVGADHDLHKLREERTRRDSGKQGGHYKL